MGELGVVFPLKSARKQDAHSFYSFNLVLEVLARVIRQEEEIKGRTQMTLFVDDIILYLKDAKSTIRKLVDLINTFSKVADNTVNIQKSVTS